MCVCARETDTPTPGTTGDGGPFASDRPIPFLFSKRRESTRPKGLHLESKEINREVKIKHAAYGAAANPIRTDRSVQERYLQK